MDTNFQPITSKNARGPYRQHPLEFKRALAALSLESGVSVARIAREHGVNANQVFSWRDNYVDKHRLKCSPINEAAWEFLEGLRSVRLQRLRLSGLLLWLALRLF